MSKNKRHQDNNFRVGKLCSDCQKGKYEKAECSKVSKRGHKKHVVCKTCHNTNF